jgi:hypothetical protein
MKTSIMVAGWNQHWIEIVEKIANGTETWCKAGARN